MDTQGRRYQVFVQERPGAPFQDAGSVHASDAELALLNARDVFARRPQVCAMWVVPVEAIAASTLEEWAAAPPDPDAQDTPVHRFQVFCKPKPAGTQIQQGEIEASSAQAALRLGRAAFGGRYPAERPPAVWWVFPAERVIASRPEDVAGMYAPAADKGFRLSTDFHTHTAMRRLKQGEE